MKPMCATYRQLRELARPRDLALTPSSDQPSVHVPNNSKYEMALRAVALLIVVWLQLSSSSSAFAQAPSASGTIIPPATQIVDGGGNVWTMPSLSGPGNIIYENGTPTTGSGSHVQVLYYGGTMYAENTGSAWYRWTGSGWAYIGKTYTGVSQPSASGTIIPPATQIVDGSGNVWTMPSLSSPGTIIYENGRATTGDGNHVALRYYNGWMLAENTGNNWYQWTGSAWVPFSLMPKANNAQANWQMAGMLSVGGGIPYRTTVCATVNPIGGGADDFTNIQNAINSCPSGGVVQLAAGAFTIHLADMPIQISTSVVLRGTGNCGGSSSPYCQTSITVSDGALAYTGGMCGTDASHQVACPNGGFPEVLVSPVFGYNWSWAQCGNVGSTVGTGCGATPLGADAAQGQNTIQVNSTTGFSVGMWVLIDEASGAQWVKDPLNAWTGYGSVWAASDWLSSSGSPATGRVMWSKSENGGGWDFGSTYPYQAGSVGCWFSYCDRPTAELHKIASIGAGPCPGTGCTLTFDDPLTVAFRQSGSHNAQVYRPYGNQSGTVPVSFLQNAGVENISLVRSPSGGLSYLFCAYCWAKNVEVGDWYGGGIDLAYTVRTELNGVYVHHCWDSVNNGGEYPIAIDSASTELLVDNSITNFAGKGMVARAGGAGSVVSYNYQDDTMYDAKSGIGDYWVDMGVNASHYSGPHHILFEGNWGDNLDNDHTHGNSVYITFFRNQGTGLRTPFTDPSMGGKVNDAAGLGYACGTTGASGCSPSPPGPLRAAGPMAYNYWFAFVGNVLGLSGVTTSANGWTYQGDWTSSRIFMLGWNDGNGGQDPYLDGTSGSYIFRHGNYDYVNAAVTWDSGTPDHVLPNSFYLTSTPAFFNGYRWPWVNPTGSPQLYTLPAKARYGAGTPFTQP